jgi:hypothetical protein
MAEIFDLAQRNRQLEQQLDHFEIVLVGLFGQVYCVTKKS